MNILYTSDRKIYSGSFAGNGFKLVETRCLHKIEILYLIYFLNRIVLENASTASVNFISIS